MFRMVGQATLVYGCVSKVRSIYRITAEMVLYLLKMYLLFYSLYCNYKGNAHMSFLFCSCTNHCLICKKIFECVSSSLSWSNLQRCISICLAQANSLQIRQICICDWCSVIFLTRCKTLRSIAQKEKYFSLSLWSVPVYHFCESFNCKCIVSN